MLSSKYPALALVAAAKCLALHAKVSESISMIMDSILFFSGSKSSFLFFLFLFSFIFLFLSQLQPVLILVVAVNYWTVVYVHTTFKIFLTESCFYHITKTLKPWSISMGFYAKQPPHLEIIGGNEFLSKQQAPS